MTTATKQELEAANRMALGLLEAYNAMGFKKNDPRAAIAWKKVEAAQIRHRVAIAAHFKEEGKEI